MKVLKRDGSQEEFDVEKLKISIVAAAKDAEVDSSQFAESVAQTVAQGFSGKDQIGFSEIRDAVLVELAKVAPTAVEAWKNHEKGVKGLLTQ
ncbi:MAG: hypothetical protein A2418_00965 [Candidatus Brennerbacteria bacterium RIFOXYC1_FULL_41_11]|uniref:ATP-cone domain-containing protein n=1 Tax=Candidatus Brennerbacteria bacterium RIFOXYD1_FULL_41_16 TaxID=1797529 RepID=A0A1G1XN78_9BACT|nr:MAG: Anaerobic ribonucleoside-triphosphate reductase [Parcubacteria group bacterium GW2011_GWB1_41_4]OGY38609.1 MAG: hypothetical protein A2391_03395 [Candidatus Brennerbacteria bacterium RIFOXYB1_FULL_41_13]OGY38872.1 MAG: hypothetical protein A2418_00965 [Candidatus Brennerbacteria bacterium RIFOXYC1_FULL_41_11]OGY41030.1 MAG: hypothetical protein A2570_00090 [Candidatus Brennerbacteria bacterium RIFOXYD1_FULL_41_16]